MNKDMVLMGIIMMIVGFGVYSLITTIVLNLETKIVKVDCYDKYGNVINGVTCDEEIYIDDTFNGTYVILIELAGIVMFFIGLIGIISIIGGFIYK